MPAESGQQAENLPENRSNSTSFSIYVLHRPAPAWSCEAKDKE
jgi:hypothetical protein